MIKAFLRGAILSLALSFDVSASSVLKNDILKPEAIELIDKMSDELSEKVAVRGYVIATNEAFPVGYNLVAHSTAYNERMDEPYVLFIMAPLAHITSDSTTTGRMGIIPSSDEVRKMYDADDVRDATLNVITVKDKNSNEDKHNIGVLQGFSELAEQIAASKSVQMTTTIPNEAETMIWVLRVIIYIGSVLVLWIFLLRPIYMRIKYGKSN